MTRSAWMLAVVLWVGAGLRPVSAGTELDDALRALSFAKEPKARLELVAKLAAHDTDRVVATLARLARQDDSAAVRAAAVTALGRSKNGKADKLLQGVLKHGGPLGVRRATAVALGTRPDGVDAILDVVDAKTALRLQRAVAVDALGFLRDHKSFVMLQRHATDAKSPYRIEALRALARRDDRKKERLTTYVRLLTTARDRETTMTLLDAAEGFAHPTMRPAARRLAESLEPAVKEAAEHLLHCIREASARPAAPPADVGEGHRYAKPHPDLPPVETPPPDPGPRGRLDLVYMLDVTGSAFQNLPRLRARILREFELLEDVGTSVRVGIIAYRSRRERRRAEDVLPLTFDGDRLRAFLEKIDPGGVDDRGAAIGKALHEALDTMPWRHHARRRVMLFADTGLGDPREANRVVSIHFRTDKTRTRVAYVLRTRTVVPDELERLAHLGGSRYVELLR